MTNTRKRALKSKMLRELREQKLPNRMARVSAALEYGEPPKETLADYYPLRRCQLGGLYAVTFRDKHGESWIKAWLLPGNASDEKISASLGIYEYYDGPGRSFGRKPFVQRSGKRTLVMQQCGYDV